MKTNSAVISFAVALCAAQSFAETHTVTFRRMNGTVLQTIEVAHGADATSQKPTLPAESGMTAQKWDCVEKLANVTNDVTCWALYEATTAMSPSTSIASQSVVDRATPYSLDEYFQMYDNLAWSDEFSGTSLSVGYGSGKNWKYDTEQRNNELQKYTQGGNHIVSDGTLKLECRRESSGGKSFTSGSIKSQGTVQFKYGRCEIRAKFNKQKGTWPAFWTMGTGSWPACGELDVFEQINGSEWIGGNFHLPNGSSTISNSALVCPEDGTHWGDAFHRIGFIWNEFEAVWYVDDHIFKRMDIRNTSRYSMLHDRYRYILLNLAFGGNWPGQTDPNDSSIANFTSEAFEIDYCRIFTNTTANRTIAREAEPEGAKLTAPVNAAVWRGWQMRWGKSGAYRSGLDRSEADFFKAAMTEYFTRDNADIVTFLTRPAENTGASDLTMPFNVPGVTSLFLSPEQGSNNNSWEGDTREKLLSGVLFNKNRFSQSRSAISSLPLTNDANYTNCCAVVAELVEKDSGAKVKVVSVNLSQTNGTDYATLFDKLNQFKNERTILLFQSMDGAYHTPLKNQASSKLDKAYKYLGEYKVWPTYQFSYATTNCVSATATNPAPLSVPKSNGQASGVHTNQAYCATVQFDAEPETVIEYGQLDKSAFSKKMDVTFSGYSGTTLTDFPVLVKLSTAISGFSYGDFQKSNGEDLRFADSTGKLLPHEIDTWNPSGVSTVWVKVPSLAANGKITACYGCANPPEVAAKDVWDANYVGVWHLGGGSTTMKESTLVTSDLTASGTGMDLAAAGIVGGAVDFKEYNKGRKLVAPDHDALDGFSACTLEAWTYQTNQNQNAGILCKRAGYNNSVSYQIYDGGGNGSPSVGLTMGTNSTSGVATGASLSPALSQWNHLVYTFNSGTITGYKNGTAGTTKSFPKSTVLAGTGKLCVGGFDASDARNFPGKIDEVRISKTVRSADWVKATHDTIADASFATYTVDGVAPPEPDRILYVNVAAGVTNTLNAALVTSYITNIVKRGEGTLRATAIADYEGDFTLEKGVFCVGVKNGAGKDKYANTIYVGPGASLEFTGDADNILDNKKVILEGAAAAGAKGKFVSNGGWKKIGTGMTFTLRSDAEFACMRQRMIFSGEVFDLGGHTLTVKNTGSNQANFDNSTFRNGGHVVVGEYMTILHESGTLTFETPISGSPSVILMSNATFNLKTAVSASGWTLYATNSNATITGNATRWPNNVNNAVWDGSLVLGGNNKIASYQGSSANVSNNVFNLKGAISGSGTLNLGPGWLNLHTANNTYSGAVWVNGRSAPNVAAPILAGGGGIGLWNGAACFPNASSITFTNTACLAFMDNTACTVPNVTFVALAGETQSISGGVYTARSTIAGITKAGAGTLLVDSPAQVTGLADIQGGTLKVAYSAPIDATQEGVLAPQPQFASLKFASGTTFDLSDNVGFVIVDLDGSPSVTNSGLFGITGKWTLRSPADKLTVAGENAMFGEQSAAGCLAFQGATFEIPSDQDAAFVAAAESNGGKIEVARANWVVSQLDESTTLPMPTASASTNPRWSMEVGSDGRSVMLVLAPAGGYAAWIADKGITGSAAAFDKETNGIKNGVRYAFDIDPANGPTQIGTPIIQVVRDANGNPSVQSRDLATGRDDITFGILATENLNDWTSATVVVPMKKFSDGFWKPTASENNSSYVFPSKMFFKYTIEVK